MIVFAISSLGIGGAQMWVRNLARVLADRFEVEIAYGGLYGGISASEAEGLMAGLTLVRIPDLHRPFHPTGIVGAYQYLASRPDAVVVVSSFAAGTNLRLAAMLSGNEVYYVSHGWSFRYQRPLSGALARVAEAALGRVSKVLCVSEADLVNARESLRIPPARLALVRNRILADGRTPIATREARPIRSVRRVLYVGRQAPPKRFDLYVELSRRFPDVEFHAVGPMPEDFDSVPESIVLHGRVGDFNRYHEFDVFCLFSDSEGLPMSALEAHAHGVPLLLSNVGGAGELVGCNGLLVENEIGDITEKFARMVADITPFEAAAARARGRFVSSPTSIVRLVERSFRQRRRRR